jgi:two-component system phosphate regulon sensor histidine kinase PhoR
MWPGSQITGDRRSPYDAFTMPEHTAIQLIAYTLNTTLGVMLLCCIALVVFLLVIIRRYRKWLDQIGRSANRLAKGDFSKPIEATGPPPVAALADTLNQMAQQLDDRLSEVVRQRNELGTILSSMDEGVIAVDSELRVISLNRSAATLLQLDPAMTIDRTIDQAISDPELRRFVSQPLETGKGVQGEVSLARTEVKAEPPIWTKKALQQGDDEQETVGETIMAPPMDERIIEATSAILRDAAGRRMGVVLVLHDVSELRRLESIRQDFVANVSHEIRTPISAIKAAAETLFDDMDYRPDEPPDLGVLRNFLGIIARQAERLHAIVEDLLALARIEQGKREDAIELIPEPLSPVIAAAVETCQAKADEKDISIRVDCEFGLMADMNRTMLEQALINLIDNAVKYSPDMSKVEVVALKIRSEVKITVLDEGRGIESEHLPRLFERFYRTDRARSRQMGGTGLGLSIVKHIAEAHGGRVSVESRPNVGSTFILTLPLPD